MVKLEVKGEKKKEKLKEKSQGITFRKPVFHKIVSVGETEDKKNEYVVSEWIIRVGHFYPKEKREEIEKLYQPLEEGKPVKTLTIRRSGRFFNLVGFELLEGSSEEEPSSYDPCYLVCLIDPVYPIDSNKKCKVKVGKNKFLKGTELLNFKFSNDVVLNFKQIGWGYHFLPVRMVMDLFRYGFDQFCTVLGLIKPDGSFIKFSPRPKSFEELGLKLCELGYFRPIKGELNVGSQAGKK